MKNHKTIDTNALKTRDHLLVALIQGVTKAAVYQDRKKEQNKRACRKPVDEE